MWYTTCRSLYLPGYSIVLWFLGMETVHDCESYDSEVDNISTEKCGSGVLLSSEEET
jgi:hypothetical protein